jgi:hypothetical protein
MGASVFLLALLNLLASVLIKEKDTRQAYYNQVLSLTNRSAYFHQASRVSLSAGYIEENIRDNINYTYLPNGEFDYYPRLEDIHSPYQSEHINVVKTRGDLPCRMTLTIDTTATKLIYCFGGSTTFGTLISDEHTWPSLLMRYYQSKAQHVNVKNYGYCGHNASQATQAFLELLRLGHRPSLAIFMDGINVGPPYDGCEYSQGIADRFKYTDAPEGFIKMLRILPIARLLLPSLSPPFISLDKKDAFALILPVDSSNNLRYANRLIENALLRQKIGELYGVKVLSILQPNIFYKYDLTRTTPFFRRTFQQAIFNNYKIIYDLTTVAGVHYDLSDLWREYPHPAIVDILHYSPDFNRFLAEKIAESYDLKDLRDYQYLESKASGMVFDKDY